MGVGPSHAHSLALDQAHTSGLMGADGEKEEPRSLAGDPSRDPGRSVQWDALCNGIAQSAGKCLLF